MFALGKCDFLKVKNLEIILHYHTYLHFQLLRFFGGGGGKTTNIFKVKIKVLFLREEIYSFYLFYIINEFPPVM